MTRRTQRLIGLIAAIALVMGGIGFLSLRSRSSAANAAGHDVLVADAPPSTGTPTATPTGTPDGRRHGPWRHHAKPAQSSSSITPSSSAPASPTPSSSTPSAPATTTPPAVQAAAGSAAAAASSVKKGAVTWNQDGITSELKDSGVSWFYNWATDRQQIKAPAGVEFVPMIWGANAVTAGNLSTVKKSGNTLLAFNEPDMAAQSNVSVDTALKLWPQLESTGQRLGAPAVAWGADQSDTWLGRFMKGAKEKNYRVDFIPLHWYGSDFNSKNATNQLKSYIEAVHKKYNKPIWLTEYALINFGSGQKFPSADNQAQFVKDSTAMLQSLSYVERYSWFAFPTSSNGQDETGLYRPGGAITKPGEAYRAAR